MVTRMALLLFFMVECIMAQTPATEDAAQKWGLKQMSHMLADRPVMKTFIIGGQTHWVTREDTIWKWVAEHYAGKVTGFHAAWHEAPPTGDGHAMHAYGPDKVYIYVALPSDATEPSHNRAFEQMWSSVVFELLNMENAAGFGAATQEARAGRCTREEFILMYAKVEHQTVGKMQEFFRTVWLPWSQKTGFQTNPHEWRRGYHPDFTQWVSQYPPDNWYPWKCYGEGYDEIRRKAAKTLDTEKPVK